MGAGKGKSSRARSTTTAAFSSTLGAQSQETWSNTTSLPRLGITADELRDNAKDWMHDLSPRTFSVTYTDTPDGEPIIGLAYQTDYKYEEEAGVGELRKAITGDNPRNFCMTAKARNNFALFADKNAITLSIWPVIDKNPNWDPKSNYGDEWDYGVPYAQGIEESPSKLSWEKIPQLRERAKKLGIKPLPSKKNILVSAISSHPNTAKKSPEKWPGYFQRGDKLTLRADGDGLAARVLTKLVDAAENGTLGIGDSSGPFSTGIFLYDTRDETPGLITQREADFDWYDERMAELKPVREELEEKGFKWYFLGKPAEIDGKTKYWLNGQAGKGYKQPSGWYTLDELRSEKFIKDAKQRELERNQK